MEVPFFNRVSCNFVGNGINILIVCGKWRVYLSVSQIDTYKYSYYKHYK